MNSNSEILLKINFDGEKCYHTFPIELSKLRLLENKNLEKNIKIIASELIQNNFIHNHYKKSLLKIEKTSNSIMIDFVFDMDITECKRLGEKIEIINNYSDDELTIIKKNNLISKNLDENRPKTGNGLIICKLKTKNKIDFFYKTDNLVQKIANCKITLKIDNL